MTDYAAIDATIEAWKAVHGLTVFTEFGGKARRFAHLSVGGECFQISIDPREGAAQPALWVVNLWSVETDDDCDVHLAWTATAVDLAEALEVATECARSIGNRPKTVSR